MRRSAWAAALVAVGVTVAGCSGSSPGGGGGKNGADASGTIKFVTGKDTTGKLNGLIAKWNSSHPSQKVELLELSEEADQQRNAMVQNAQAKSSTYDILNLDVVWTSEFAGKGWIVPLNQSDFPKSNYLGPVYDTATYGGKLYAAPFTSDGGMLYYRKDLVPQPPKTWDELIKDCAIAKSHNMDCYAGQFAQYEGLTVNASEAINSAGGDILKNDGKDVKVNSDKAKKGLQFLVDGFKQGYIPKAAITYKEEEGRRSFQSGKLLFLRNWPYVYGLASTPGPDTKIVGKFGIAPLPGLDGPGATTLGGHNLAISKYSKHQKGAQAFLKYFTSPANEKDVAIQLSLAPATAATYDDPDVIKALPFVPVLKQAILNAKSRPKTPFYNDVTTAIEEDSYQALQGKKTVDQALSDLEKKLKEIVKQK